ncbi:hypothetical protein Tco_0584557 [Tanacetum coccineum]
MTTLQFADTHNLVAFLSKLVESEGFEQIIDFLNANPIKYALTINPTIYTSCIEQFWAIVKVKTVNREVQLQALVDGKKIIITKASVRRDLQLNDEEADETVNEEMDDSLVRAATTASSLEAEQDSGNIDKTRSKAALNEPSSLGTSSALGLSKRVESSEDEGLGEEDASKQGRIADIDVDAGINLVSTHFDADTDMFGVMLHEPETGTKLQQLLATTITAASTRPNAKGLVIHEDKQATTLEVSSQQPSQVKAKDKGKGIMVEEPKKAMKKKELIRLDEEIASKLQAEFNEEVRLAREKAEKEEEANIVSWDNVQAMIDVDYQMGQQMQAEEQDCSKVRAEAEIAQESSSKRAGTELEQESIKKQKVDEDKETAELQRLIEVVPDKEEVAIDAIPLATKPPSIVDYKIHKEGKKTYYQIIRADGSSKMYLVFSHMLKSFDREDLETLWKLVKAKHGSTRPEEGYERVLWGDLKTMFDPHVEDQVWKNQSDYRVLDWKLYDSCGVHSLRKQNVHIHMLVEKRYPLTPATITDMLNRKLQADHWNEMCYQLLKLITKQLKNQ